MAAGRIAGPTSGGVVVRHQRDECACGAGGGAGAIGGQQQRAERRGDRGRSDSAAPDTAAVVWPRRGGAAGAGWAVWGVAVEACGRRLGCRGGRGGAAWDAT